MLAKVPFFPLISRIYNFSFFPTNYSKIHLTVTVRKKPKNQNKTPTTTKPKQSLNKTTHKQNNNEIMYTDTHTKKPKTQTTKQQQTNQPQNHKTKPHHNLDSDSQLVCILVASLRSREVWFWVFLCKQIIIPVVFRYKIPNCSYSCS